MEESPIRPSWPDFRGKSWSGTILAAQCPSAGSPTKEATPLLAATNYPLLEVFWTMLIFFAFFIWIWLLITVFMDVFRRQDIGGWGKTAWIVFVIILPYLGV